jgi:hypothetical protein
MKNKQILDYTFQLMPERFSSNEFSIVAQKNWLPIERIKSGIIAEYLHKNKSRCIQESRRTWRKIGISETSKGINQDKCLHNNIQCCIDRIKALGYKVLRPKTEYVEI